MFTSLPPTTPTLATVARRYALSVAVWSVALALTIVFAPYLSKTIFILFWPAVFVCAWYAGRGPAYLCIVLSTLAANYLMVLPRGFTIPGDPSALTSLVFFVILAGGVAELVTQFRHTAVRARSAEAESAVRASELQEQALELEIQAEELARSNLELQYSEGRFRNLFEENPQSMWVFDLETLRFVDVNEAAIREYGYSRDEFLRMTIRDIRPEKELAHLAEALRADADIGQVHRGTFQHRRKDGSLLDVEITAQDVEHDGRRARVILAVDVTEREHLLRAERSARSLAEQANQAKTDFLATMSHELRTPLNAIAGYAELLEMGIHGPVTSEQRSALERILRSQRHLLGLINDVLNFAKLSAGRVEYDIENVLVRRTIDALEPLVSVQIDAKRLKFTREDCGDALVVRADEDKVRQILLNLLSNAIKFTGEDGEIALRCESDDQMVRISVQDTGIGIPSDRLSHIFEPFVQIDRRLSSRHEGTGLGLAISRDLARAMGGDITVTSEQGRGSTFTVALPRG